MSASAPSMNDRDKNDSSNDAGGIRTPLVAKTRKDFHAAVEMTYEEAAIAAPGMTHEQAFQIGKNVGIHIGGAARAGRDMMSVNEHLRVRQLEGDKMTMLCAAFQLKSPGVDAASWGRDFDSVQKLLAQDSDFLNAQNRLHRQDLVDNSVKLFSMQKKSEEQTKDEN